MVKLTLQKPTVGNVPRLVRAVGVIKYFQTHKYKKEREKKPC